MADTPPLTPAPAVAASPAAAAADAGAADSAPFTYGAFTVPDGYSLPDQGVLEFTGILNDGQLSYQERGQRLVDMYVRDAQRIVAAEEAQHKRAWSDYIAAEVGAFRADPELGGDRQETTLGRAKYVIDRFGGTEAQKADLYSKLDYPGLGNSTGLVRVLNNIFETYMAKPSQSRRDVLYGDAPAKPSQSRQQSLRDALYGEEDT
jgi:hypothetical protein